MYDIRVNRAFDLINKLEKKVDANEARIEALEKTVVNLLAIVRTQAELGHKTVQILRERMP